jgi:hypothetical protein
MLRARLSVEPLEAREVPAGAVTASVAAGVLTITGDDFDNKFTIQRQDDAIEIIGTETLVNENPESVRIAGPINSIKVTTFGGADQVSISDLSDFVLPGFAQFDLGDGSNTLKLVTTGQLSIGALTVKGGDGLDTTQIDAAAGSQIGTSALFQYGIGGSTTTMKHLAFPGAGQVTLAAADGVDSFTLDDCQTKGVTFSGGYGQGSLIIKNSSVGPVTLNGSQGPGSVSLVNSTVTGPVKAVGPEGIQVSLDGTTVTGNVTALGGLFDLDSAVGLTIANAVSVTGNVTVKGYTTSINMQPNASLTATGDITGHATDALTATGTDCDIAAHAMFLTSPRAISFTQSGVSSSLALTGGLIATGRIVDLSLGQVNIDKLVTITGSAKAGLKVQAGTLDQSVTVTSSLGSAALTLGTSAPMEVGGNVYVSGKLSTSTGLAGTFHNYITVNGGAKEDSFVLGEGTYEKNVTAQLKDGNNLVGIGHFAVNTVPTVLGNLKVTTGNGADHLAFLCHIGGGTMVTTGGGADQLFIYRSTFDGPATILTGTGDDSLAAADGWGWSAPVTFNGKATIDLGAGNDTLIMGTALGDPQQGGGDANSQVIFAPGFDSTVSGGTGINTFDDEAGQFAGVSLGAEISGWNDPT